MRSFGVRYPESMYSPSRGRMSLYKSAVNRATSQSNADIPGKCKGQPVCQSPCDQHNTLRQPYSTQGFLIDPRAGSEVYGDKQDNADGKSESKEDRKYEVCRGGS